ncbi:SDR family oxidoreductase [Arenibaculum pallidiluteum]|uniref:SDR family oxidoreductase n=1 Tax=Arenibaculum pallidiluteum TaxID=2812559 RepID=UPI001A96CB62|nr:SDR family oxidoreductase [Arenibaculum pallidiluteum]
MARSDECTGASMTAVPFAVRRMAEPEEITRLVLFLSSDESAFMTGSDYVVDGGLLLGPVPPDGG